MTGVSNSHAVAIVIATTLAVGLVDVPLPAQTQSPAATNAADAVSVAKARRMAERFKRLAGVLTVFDRTGKVVTTVGEPAIYQNPVFSPDRTRLAVWKNDLERDTEDIWVLDVATGAATRITANKTNEQEAVRWPVWSPDGRQLAYVALRAGHFGLYRKASNGVGTEELLYQHPGGGVFLLDWSVDGRFLSYSSTDLSGGTLYALPLDGDGARQPIEVFRSTSRAWGSRVSPDGRFIAYASEESGTQEVHVRPFSASASSPGGGPWQLSRQGARGPAYWGRDGKELYYLAADRSVMAVHVTTTPGFAMGTPTVLFRPPEAVAVIPETASVSPDGERVVIAVPASPTLQQITVFDREGHVLNKVGEPGRYGNLGLSPDGTRAAVVRIHPQTANFDIWTFDLASGKAVPFTDDAAPDNSPTWSPDGRQLAYVSTRGSYTSIFRKRSDGTGPEERLFQYTPGAGLVLTDWSKDGRFITFHDGCAGVLHVLPLAGDQQALDRKAVDWLRDEYSVAQARISPDSRFVAYVSDEIEAETYEVYVRPFDASRLDVGAGTAAPVRISTSGARGMIVWRDDGRELYYLTPDWQVMVVSVTTSPAFQAGTPRVLFTLPGRVNGNPQQWKNVSADGGRFVFALDVPASVAVR